MADWVASKGTKKRMKEKENTGVSRGLKEKIVRAVFPHIEFNVLLVHPFGDKSDF